MCYECDIYLRLSINELSLQQGATYLHITNLQQTIFDLAGL